MSSLDSPSSTTSCLASKHVSFYHLASVIPEDPCKQRRLSTGSTRLPRIVSKTYTVPFPTASTISRSFSLKFGRDCSDDREDDPSFIPDCPRRFIFKMPLFSTEPPLPHQSQHDLKPCLKAAKSTSAPLETDTNTLPELTYLQSRDTFDIERCPIVTETPRKRRRSSTTSAQARQNSNIQQQNFPCISQSPVESSSLESVVGSPGELEDDRDPLDFNICDEEQMVIAGRAIKLKPCCSTCLNAHAKGMVPESDYKEYWSPSAIRKRRQDLNNLENMNKFQNDSSDCGFKDINVVDEMDRKPLEIRMKFEENSKLVEEEESDDFDMCDGASNYVCTSQVNKCYSVMYSRSDTDLLNHLEGKRKSSGEPSTAETADKTEMCQRTSDHSPSKEHCPEEDQLPAVKRTTSLNITPLISPPISPASQSPSRKSFSSFFLSRKGSVSEQTSPYATIPSTNKEKSTTTTGKSFKGIMIGVPGLKTALQGYSFAPSATMAKMSNHSTF